MGAEVPFLAADRLTRAYGATLALDHVDLAAAQGSVLAVLGPNRSGKTTTVRISATLLRADSGRALVGGHDVLAEARAVRAMIGCRVARLVLAPRMTLCSNDRTRHIEGPLNGPDRHRPAGREAPDSGTDRRCAGDHRTWRAGACRGSVEVAARAKRPVRLAGGVERRR